MSLTDEGSTSGTYLNKLKTRNKMAPHVAVPIEPDQIIYFAMKKATAKLDAAFPPPAAADADAAGPAAAAAAPVAAAEEEAAQPGTPPMVLDDDDDDRRAC